MKKILFWLFLFSVLNTNAQVIFQSSLISSGGDYKFNADISFTYTIGEISSDIINYDNIELSQGFLQYSVLTSVGIEENKNIYTKQDFNAFPNPFNDEITVRFNTDKNYDIQIKDITGREIFTKKNIENNSTLNLSNINDGIYFMNIIVNDQIYTKKIIKN